MLPPKKSNKKPNPAKKYKKTSSKDSLAEDIFEIFDPTGISSYDDVYRSYKKNGLLSLETGLEVLGALPIIGKAGKAIKGVRTANKYIKALNKVNKVVAKTEKVVPTILKEGTTFGKAAQKVSKGGKANPIAAASIVVGEGAKTFEKGIKGVEKGTAKIVEKITAKAPAKQDAINTTAATLNTINTLSDVAGATQNQVIDPILQKQEEKEYQPVPKKVIYYNTNPKHGKVEKPGTESNTSYTPITNSIQLKKWKEQQLAYGTNSQGIMKSKMNPRKKYANGTNSNGMDPNNYIISPAEAMNDYNIMLAKAESEALSNPWLPITAMVGGLMQQGIGMAGSFTGGGKGGGTTPNPSGAKGVMAGATAAMGMNDVQEDVEVEGGEMYETPQGEVGEFEGPSHEQGGIPLEVGQDVEEGTKVYSDRLKVGGKTLAERKEARERKIANLEKAASDKLVDVATKNALKRRMEAVQKEEASDLQFQEQVNNMQAMADTMVKAFGTGVEGIQKMANGGTVGEIQYDEFGNPIVDIASMLQTPGVIGTSKSINKKYAMATPKPTAPDYMKNLEPSPVLSMANNFGEKPEIAKDYGAGDFISTFVPLENTGNTQTSPRQFGKFKGDTPEHFTGEMKTPGENKFMKALGDNMPTTGDMTKLIGNYLGMTAGMKNAAEQRSTDVTHTNVYKNAGKESQKLLDNAKASIEGQKAQAIIKASTTSRGGKKGARGSARGVNQMRAMDWLYDTALNQQIAEISANAAGQLSQIDVQKSGVAMNADQLKGKGEYDAAIANEAAKDAYYTALGLGRNQFAEGLMQAGADFNDMKSNKAKWNLVKNSGTYVQGENNGDLSAKTIDFTDPATGKKMKLTQGQINELLKQLKTNKQ
jgi:hypothetical protein